MEPAAILAAANHPAGGLNEIYGPTRFAQAAEAGEAALKGGSLTEFESAAMTLSATIWPGHR